VSVTLRDVVSLLVLWGAWWLLTAVAVLHQSRRRRVGGCEESTRRGLSALSTAEATRFVLSSESPDRAHAAAIVQSIRLDVWMRLQARSWPEPRSNQ
jgi:hypothetical protein